MTNQNLIIGNIYHIAVISVTTTPTPLATLLKTALTDTSTFDQSARGRDVLEVILTPIADITIQDRDNGNSHRLTVPANTSKPIPVLNPMNQILLTCATGPQNCVVEYYSQDPTRH